MNIFGSIIEMVASLKPGESIDFDMCMLHNARPASCYNGAVFEPWDWVLENIIGSTWEFSIIERHQQKTVTFHRALQPSKTPLYLSPDRRI